MLKGLPIILLLITLSNAGYLWPEQIRLAWTENENEMRVSWVTYWNMDSYVKYRAILCSDLDGDWNWQYGDTKSWNQAEKGTLTQYLHYVVLENLRPECYYEYSVGNGGMFMSQQYTFSGRTPDYEAPFDDDKPVNMIVYGDLGTGPIGQYTHDMLNAEVYVNDFVGVLHIGDMGYDMHEFNGRRGDQFQRMIQNVAATHAYMTVPGNHELHHNMTQYKNRFIMPDNEAADSTNTFYSFDMGPAHFIMFNTEPLVYNRSQEEIDTQVNWLREDLENANQNRDLRPWIIAGSHHPLYCSVDYRKPYHAKLGSNGDCGVDTIKVRGYLEELFYQNGVDIYFQAHVHNYERDAAIYQNKTIASDYDDQHHHINPKATIYITTGNAGNREGHNDPTSSTPQDWARSWSNDYGYGRVVVHNKTHVYFEQFSSMTKSLIDYVWIEKNISRNF